MPLLRLNCKQAHRLIAESFDRDLNLADNVRVRLHLRNCPCCGNFVKQLELMRKAMRQLGAGGG
jgi:predicted anti-sigma-YlaC factor YlaD